MAFGDEDDFEKQLISFDSMIRSSKQNPADPLESQNLMLSSQLKSKQVEMVAKEPVIKHLKQVEKSYKQKENKLKQFASQLKKQYKNINSEK